MAESTYSLEAFLLLAAKKKKKPKYSKQTDTHGLPKGQKRPSSGQDGSPTTEPGSSQVNMSEAWLLVAQQQANYNQPSKPTDGGKSRKKKKKKKESQYGY